MEDLTKNKSLFDQKSHLINNKNYHLFVTIVFLFLQTKIGNRYNLKHDDRKQNHIPLIYLQQHC